MIARPSLRACFRKVLSMRWPSFVVAAAFAALTYAFWGFVNQPTSEPAWPSKIQGFAFSPYQADQDATRDDMPTE